MVYSILVLMIMVIIISYRKSPHPPYILPSSILPSKKPIWNPEREQFAEMINNKNWAKGSECPPHLLDLLNPNTDIK